MKKFNNIKGVFSDLGGTLFDITSKIIFSKNQMLKDLVSTIN